MQSSLKIARCFVTVACIGLSTIFIGASNPALAADSQEAILDLTPTETLDTEITLENDYGWQFAPNEDADISSITLWQRGTPNTSSLTIRENDNDTLGDVVGDFTYQQSGSDTTPVATYNGDDYYAFTYTGNARVQSSDDYWMVIDPGTGGTELVGTQSQFLRYAPGTSGRAVLTGNNLYRGRTDSYLSNAVSWIYVIRRTVSSPSGGSSSGGGMPVVRSVDFVLPAGMSCSTGADVDRADGWLTLPSASDCVWAAQPSETSDDLELLGWATTQDFPVSIAQRQVDNGWGAYELTNGDGRITAVFIPAGGAAAITADTRLTPVFTD